MLQTSLRHEQNNAYMQTGSDMSENVFVAVSCSVHSQHRALYMKFHPDVQSNHVIITTALS